MPVSPVSNQSASALGGPLEATIDFASFFNQGGGGSPALPATLSGLGITQPATPKVSTQSVLVPGANGQAPSTLTTQSTTVTEGLGGASLSVGTRNTGTGASPTSVEFALPLAQDGGLSFNAIAGARPGQVVTGAGLQFSQGDVTAGVQGRVVTPVDGQTPSFTELRADMSVGTSPKFTAGATVTDKPGVAADNTEFRAGVTFPIDGDVTGTLSGRYVARPGDNNDGVGGSLRVGTPGVFGELRVDQNNSPAGQGETVGQVRLGIQF